MQEFAKTVFELASLVGPNKYAQAVAALIGFVVLGKIIEVILTRVLLKLALRSKWEIDEELIGALHRPVFLTGVLFGLGAAVRILQLPEAPAWVTLGVIRTLAVLIWYRFIATAAALILKAIGKSSSIASVVSLLPLIDTIAKVVLLALAIYAVMLVWDINVAAWLASAGIIGLAVSFAARDTLANLFAGVTIAADMPYKIGDFITLETGERGMVSQIGMRSTRLLTRDDIEITVPNGVIANGKIVNEAGGPSTRHRIRVSVGVAYGSDIDKVINVLETVATEHDGVSAAPAPRVRFRAFGDSSLDFQLLCWIDKPVDRGRILHELHCDVYKRFLQEGIEIPFPQRDLNVRNMPVAID